MPNTSARNKAHKRTMISIDASESCRREIRIEALRWGMTMREYVQMILDRRHELLRK